MERRKIFVNAAAAAFLTSSLQEIAMASNHTNGASSADDARVILQRLTDRDIPAATEFDERMRTLITVAGLTALGDTELLPQVLDRALTDRIKPVEIREAVMQCMAYCGLARVVKTLEIFDGVLKERGLKAPAEVSTAVTDDNRFAEGLKVQKGIFGEVIDKMHANAKPEEKALTVDFLTGWCFGDTYTRKHLTLAERELLTFVCIAALGGCEPQVKAHAFGNISVGNTKKMLIDAIVVLLPYIGFPQSLNALGMVNEAVPAK